MTAEESLLVGVPWDVIDTALTEILSERRGRVFESQVEWTPNLLKWKEKLNAEMDEHPTYIVDTID